MKRLKIKLWLKIFIEFWELMVDERLSKGMKWLWKGLGSEDFGRSFEIRGEGRVNNDLTNCPIFISTRHRNDKLPYHRLPPLKTQHTNRTHHRPHWDYGGHLGDWIDSGLEKANLPLADWVP